VRIVSPVSSDASSGVVIDHHSNRLFHFTFEWKIFSTLGTILLPLREKVSARPTDEGSR